MRIGVVCEGPTDYPAIALFMNAALHQKGVQASFKPLFPELDRTRPEGGWPNVLLWFNKYTAAARLQRFFSGGLFGGGLEVQPLDAIVVQLDSDILDDEAFQFFVKQRYKIVIAPAQQPAHRAGQIQAVLAAAAELPSLTQADVNRHVLVAAVEATEAWCVSIFSAKPIAAEQLRGSGLRNAFMSALETSEGRPAQQQYQNVDKSLDRREQFCNVHSNNAGRVVRDCPQFAAAVSQLAALAG